MTEALAAWIEHLRDVLIAGDQPIGAIGATVVDAARPRCGRTSGGSPPGSPASSRRSRSVASPTTSTIRSATWWLQGC